MLWSDRASEQGAGSLRQALRQIRTSFGPFADILHADRQRVALDLARIDIVSNTDSELAGGPDVRDPEFEEWLRLERSACEPHASNLRAGGAGCGCPRLFEPYASK
jgi:DNA-binding SARP family transcriptional activator